MVLFLFSALGWGQGMEDFSNSNANNTYRNGSFVGNNGVTWSYVASRDGNGDANNSGIDLPALMLRRSSDNSKVTSSTVSGGIGNFSVKLYKGFTGNGNRQVELFVNGVSKGVSTAFNDYNEHTFVANGINIAGNVIIEIRNITGNQVIIDDITWTAYPAGNVGPTITNIVQAPEATNVDPDDEVLVSAEVTDPDGIDTVKLFWGTASGSLTNEINMFHFSGNEYMVDAEIPAQLDGTTVYYHIVATDAHSTDPQSTTSAEMSYTSFNPRPVIANIELLPAEGAITSAEGVLVSADITDGDGIASAQLNWGLSPGALGNTITMTLDTGVSYSTVSEIPALAQGSVVYYSITATDSRGASITTTERNYTVQDPFPVIDEIVQVPSASSVTNTDTVSVTAEVTDSAYSITNVELQWGTTAGSYTNTIPMTLVSGNTYKTDTDIPAQTAGITVYYVVKAANDFPGTSTSEEKSYTVTNPAPAILNIVQIPDSSNVTSSDDVTVTAEVIDNDPLDNVILRWGTESGYLPNVINMNVESGDTYKIDTDIPAQADGVTVYYQIEATDDNPFPETKISLEQSYTVHDPLVFRIPYINMLRDPNDVARAEEEGFDFTQTELKTSSGGYILIENGEAIISPAINFAEYQQLSIGFEMRTYGGDTGQKLSIYVSDNGGVDYDLVATKTPTVNYVLNEQVIDLSSYSGVDGRIKFEMTEGTNGIRFRDLRMYDGYVYYNNEWRPSSAENLDDSTANLYVINGTAVLNNANVNNIVVDPGAKIEVKRVLNIAGDVINDGEIIFLSTADRTGELGPVAENSRFAGNGIVTFHRYMSDHRAYRIVSSSVNTSTSIHDNWQEGATSNTDNPHPGFGTHITGTIVDQQNGFDATSTGNPSMFTVDVVNQQYVAVPNTDVDTLEAGEAYLLYVRGDRSIDLTNNNSHGSTILRASGELAHGISIQAFPTTTAGQFIMFGNPYQSGVDINSVFANSTNINGNTYYVYDPTLGTIGQWVPVDLATGTNALGSEANQYLQVGQGAQVATLATGNSSVTFHQADKAPGHHTRTNIQGNDLSAPNMLTVQLYTTERYTNGGSVHDGFAMIFDANNSNALTPVDAVKAMGFAENMAINHDGTYLSIERREMPEPSEVFPMFTSGYAESDYTFKLKVDGLEDVVLYLDDYYTGDTAMLEAGENAYNFTVDANDPTSTASDRFAIRVAQRLGVEDNNLLSGISLFPNPMKENAFYIDAPGLDGKTVTVTVNDLLGREIFTTNPTFSGSSVKIDVAQKLQTGVYMVTVSSQGEKQSFKVIKK